MYKFALFFYLDWLVFSCLLVDVWQVVVYIDKHEVYESYQSRSAACEHPDVRVRDSRSPVGIGGRDGKQHASVEEPAVPRVPSLGFRTDTLACTIHTLWTTWNLHRVGPGSTAHSVRNQRAYYPRTTPRPPT